MVNEKTSPEFSKILSSLEDGAETAEDHSSMCSEASGQAEAKTAESAEQSLSAKLTISLETADRKSVLKQIFGSLPLFRLQRAIKGLQEILAEKQKEIEDEERRTASRQADMLAILSQMKAKGIELSEFKHFVYADDLDAKLKNSKYMYTDVNGITRFWSGQGKVPTTLAELMARDGTTKEDYLREKKKKPDELPADSSQTLPQGTAAAAGNTDKISSNN